MNNTPLGLYMDPEDDNYEQRSDGKYYLKSDLGAGDFDFRPGQVTSKPDEPAYDFMPGAVRLIPAAHNPKHIQALKDGKAPLEYLIDSVEEGDAWVLKGGADRYGVNNWRIDNILASTYKGAIRRHLRAWYAGEDNDPDSGKSHLHHIRACCAILLDSKANDTLIDDRNRMESKK